VDGSVYLGSSTDADLYVNDTNLSGRHVRISKDGMGVPVMDALARTYLMVGQGRQQSSAHQLKPDDIIKMGACSLQVTEVCCAGASAWGTADA